MKVLGAAGAEVTFRPLGSTVDFLARHGLLGEGHPYQRLARLEGLMQMIELDPLNTEKKETLVSWLKFNAAELYGPVAKDAFAVGQGEPTAAHFVRHFLYGNGRPYNVMPEYADSWFNFYQKAGTRKALKEDPSEETEPLVDSSNRAIQLQAERAFTRGFYHQIFPDNPPVSNEFEWQPDGDIKVSTVVGAYDQIPGGRENQDMWRTLHYYTLKVIGQPKFEELQNMDQRSAPGVELPYYSRITLENPSLEVFDKYDFGDFRKTHTTTIGGAIKDLLQFIGFNDRKRIGNLVGQDKLAALYDMPLEIGHEDGVRVVKYGFADEFTVTGNEKLDRPFVFFARENIVNRMRSEQKK